MTLHEALSQLKILGDRIDSAILKPFIVMNKKINTKINGLNIEDFKGNLKSNMQSVNDLINRRNAIKSALVVQNALVEINVGNYNMTLAEAIDMKQIGIPIKERLLDQIKTQLSKALDGVNIHNDKLEVTADNYISQLYGNKEKADPTDVKTARDSYIKPLTMEIVDPNQLQKIIDSLEKEIDELNSKIDSAISVANAINKINIEY